jgi:hypothetical protein|tara:strand:+ start:4265 stop:4456 length:192 start_codon:yes stop_codon:yes gene_type:complete
MTTTKYRNYKTTKNKNVANKTFEKIQKTYPNITFELFERDWQGKDKKSYTIRSVIRKGGKRNG